MVEYSTVNAKLSNSQVNKLKSGVENTQETILRMNARILSANNSPHELLLTTRQTTKQRNAIENNMLTDIKSCKAQISKIIQSGGFVGKLLGPLLKTGLKNVIKPLAKSVLIPLGLAAAASAAYAGIQKKIYGSGKTTLVISNGEMNDMMKIVQALKNLNILLKGISETIKNETIEQNGGFLSMLLGTLGKRKGKGTVRAGERIVRVGYGSSIKKALIPPYPLTNFEIKENYENEHGLNVVQSRDNLPKIRTNEAYVINLNEYGDIGMHCIALYVKIMKLFTLIVSVLKMLLKKLIDSLDKKTQKQIHLEYKQTIQKCVNTFVLNLLILCFQEEVRLFLLVCFLVMISRKMIK